MPHQSRLTPLSNGHMKGHKMQRLSYCEHCGSGEDTLHVHHKHYRKGADVWDYADSELLALCDACHQQEHNQIDVIRRLAGAINHNHRDSILNIIAGYLYAASNGCTDILHTNSRPLPVYQPTKFIAGATAYKTSNQLDLNGIGRVADVVVCEVEKRHKSLAILKEKTNRENNHVSN